LFEVKFAAGIKFPVQILKVSGINCFHL